MNRKIIWLLFLILFCALLGGQSASSVRAQTRYYVNQDTGNDLNDGRTWATAFKTLQKALSVARAGDEIWVARGIYYPIEGLYPPPSNPRNASFNIPGGVKLIGGFAGYESAPELRDIQNNETILSGDIDKDNVLNDGNSRVVVTVSSGNVILDGFIITGGYGGYSYSYGACGGGMYVSGSVNLINTKLFRNRSNGYGGALCVNRANVFLENVEIKENYSYYDGGGINLIEGSMTMTNVTIRDNNARMGGGIHVSSRSTSLYLDKVSILNNTANYGGGIYLSDYSGINIVNSTIANNSATYYGGGIYRYDSYGSAPGIILKNVTIFKNSAGSSGGGIYSAEYSGSLAALNMVIIAGSVGGDCVSRGAQISAQYSLFQDPDPNRTCGMTSGGTNLIGVDPQLDPDPWDLTTPQIWGGRLVHLPLRDSPVIDAGTNTDCPNEDQLSFARPLGNSCDIGAVEFTFSKRSPPHKSTNQPLNITLTWDSFAGAQGYEVCIDTVDNNICDGSWQPVGNVTSWEVSGLAGGTTYYWQVRARNAAGTTEANNGAWWRFTTQVSAPGAFSKISPSDGATGQPTSLTLSWGSSSGATSYEYCYDTVNNNACDTSWISVGNNTSAVISGLSGGTTYYWQVRARNAAGTTEANNGAWWRFSTQAALYPVYLPLVLRHFGSGYSETLIYETFEGSFPGSWQLYSNSNYDWGKRSCRPYNGSYSGWSVGGGTSGSSLPCSANYPNDAQTWMIYGPFGLIGMTDADMTFKLWLNTERDYDFICWGASIDGYNFYVDCLSGNSNGWIDVKLDLKNVPGLGNLMGQPNVWVGLVFISDQSITMQGGAYVDNIRIRRCTGTCPSVGSLISFFGEGLSTKSIVIHLLDFD